MGRITYLFLFLVCFTCNLYAQEFGFDTLAGAKYPKVVRSIPNQYGIGVFAETFGDAFPLVKNELYRGRAWVRVQFIWSDTHSFGDKDIPTLRRLAKKYAPLCNTGRLQVSFFCEHNVNNPDKYGDIVAALMPGCEIINTPWRGALSRKYLNEVHGTHAVPQGFRYQYSEDGGFPDNTDPNDIDKEKNKRLWSGAKRYLFWTARFNLRWSMKDTRPRAERLRDPALPDENVMGGQLWYTTPKGTANVKKTYTIKPFSEKHGANDTKGDKLLIIAPIKSNKVTLKREGKLIAELPFYGNFDGGGFRYYDVVPGWKRGANLSLIIDGKKRGTFNGGYRDGNTRD